VASFSVYISLDCPFIRFYCALYKKLLDPGVATASSRQVMFINLVFNAMNKDPAVNRVKAFIKRLLQVFHLQFPFFLSVIKYMLN
jgi:ribosome biogenesis protein MAK21